MSKNCFPGGISVNALLAKISKRREPDEKDQEDHKDQIAISSERHAADKMIKVLVMSDSHGAISELLEIISAENPDIIIHLGDYASDCRAAAKKFPDIPLKIIGGNGDFSATIPSEDFFVLGNKFIYATHGHRHSVKAGLSQLINFAKSKSAEIVLFGHTHIPHCEISENFAVINPGSVHPPYCSYAVLSLSGGDLSCEIKAL